MRHTCRENACLKSEVKSSSFHSNFDGWIDLVLEVSSVLVWIDFIFPDNQTVFTTKARRSEYHPISNKVDKSKVDKRQMFDIFGNLVL